MDFVQQAQVQNLTDEDLVRQAGYALPERRMFDPRPAVENDLIALAGELRYAHGALSMVTQGQRVPDFDSDRGEIAGDDLDTQYWAEQIEVRSHKLRKACATTNTANDQQPGGGQ